MKQHLPWKVVAVGLISKDKKILLGLRPQKNKKSLWEFPGGKIKQGEQAEEALKRELKEELGLSVKKSSLACVLTDCKEDQNFCIIAFHVSEWEGEEKALWHDALKWFTLEDCLELKVPNINPSLFKSIIEILKTKILIS